ncbi:MAG: MerR family transcriptional regulator [Acidimicrobiia bacterium]
MLISELAARQGVDAGTIRYYEAIGVLPPPVRSQSGYRLYGTDDEARLRFVKAARSLGITLGQIKEILRLRDEGVAPCAYVTEVITRRIDEVGRAIEDLTELETELLRLRRRARRARTRRPAAGSYCHILEPS